MDLPPQEEAAFLRLFDAYRRLIAVIQCTLSKDSGGECGSGQLQQLIKPRFLLAEYWRLGLLLSRRGVSFSPEMETWIGEEMRLSRELYLYQIWFIRLLNFAGHSCHGLTMGGGQKFLGLRLPSSVIQYV